ncbi:hypothetical protein BH09BAC4_BH09BAC4_39740 [soil metagenome]
MFQKIKFPFQVRLWNLENDQTTKSVVFTTTSQSTIYFIVCKQSLDVLMTNFLNKCFFWLRINFSRHQPENDLSHKNTVNECDWPHRSPYT